jgi:hypothetical protein
MRPHETAGSTRGGAACIAVAGLLIPASTLLRGPFVDPHGDAAAFAAWVTGRTYTLAGKMFIVGIVFQILGVMALYPLLARGGSPRLAFVGTLLTLLTDALLLVVMGVFCFTLPEVGRMYREGRTEVLSMATAFGAPFTAFLVVQALALGVGTLLTAVAIWRSPEIPRVVRVDVCSERHRNRVLSTDPIPG